MTFQAWFDESGSKAVGRWMVVAGLFGQAQVFASVADEWERYLAAAHPGRIRYFKMYEACNLTGEFAHWRDDNRDAKVRQMAKVIDRDDLLVISARLDLEAFDRYSKHWAHVRPEPRDPVRHHSMVEPYMLLFQGVFTAAVEEAFRRGQTSQMEIVFDDQDMLRSSILTSYQPVPSPYAT